MRSSQRIRQTLRKYQRKPVTQQGILGNEVGEIAVPNRTDYVYVRVAGLGTISIYNKRVPLILDLPVDVGYDPLEPKNFQVLNIHRYPQGGGRGLVDVATILHGKNHNWAGIDPVYIEKRQLMPLRPTPLGGMQVYVTREVTYYDDKAVAVTGQQLDMSPYVPATGSLMVLIYKDTDELIKIRTGSVLKDLTSLSLSDAPPAYPGTVPIALIRLYGGQSGIAEGYQDTDLIDVRQLFSPIDLTGTSSGGVVTGGHNIMDEGATLPHRAALNFIGSSVWAVDNAGQNRTDIIISGTSSGVSTGTAVIVHDHFDYAASAYKMVIATGSYSTTYINQLQIRFDAIASVELDGAEYQAVTYWDADSHLVIATRRMPGYWILHTQSSIHVTSADTHRASLLGLDENGYIHVAYDHSGNGTDGLKYRKSNAPISTWTGTLTNALSMLGTNETVVEYPTFFNDKSGKLYFMFMAGNAGDSNTYFYTYNAITETWAAAAGTSTDGLLIDGDSSTHSAYLNQPWFDEDNNLHLFWIWTTPSLNTRSNPSYVKWDGTDFHQADGDAQTVPITYANCEVVETIAPTGIAQNTGAMSDAFGRPHIVYRISGSEIKHAYYNGTQWVLATIPITPPTGAGGSIGIYPRILIDDDNIAYILYSDDAVSELGIRVLKSRANDFTVWTKQAILSEGVGGYCPKFDANQWRKHRVMYLIVEPYPDDDSTYPIWLVEYIPRGWAVWNASDYPTLHADDIDLTTGIHHTLGVGVNQAARGNHTHESELLDILTANGDLLYRVIQGYLGNQAISALGASATASDSYTTYTPDQAIDENDGTYWYSNPDLVVGAWITIDLGIEKTIHQWRMRQDDPNGTADEKKMSASAYEVEYSSNGSSWTTAVASHTAVKDETVDFASPITARYFRFTGLTCPGTQDWGWAVFTIELIAADANSLEALAIGSEGEVLTVLSGLPSWQSATASIVTGAHTIMDEGTTLPYQPVLNFIGTSLWAVNNAGQGRTDIIVSGTSSGGGHTIEDEGTPLTQRTNLNFVGASVNVTDDAGNDRTVVTISNITGSSSGDVSQYGAVTAGHVAIFHADKSIEDGGVLSTGSASTGNGWGFPADGRLTIVTGTPVTTTDALAGTVLYYTPYTGEQIALYNGVTWDLITFAELTIAIPATTSQMYDVFCYNNGGTATLELTAWTNDTTRATALVRQNGVLCKSGVLTRRYLGSVRTTTVSGQTEDSRHNRFVWNYYNRRLRRMFCADMPNHTYNGAARLWNNSATNNQMSFVCGVIEDCVVGYLAGLIKAVDSNNGCGIMIYLNGANMGSSYGVASYYGGYGGAGYSSTGYPVAGYNYMNIYELGQGGTPATFNNAEMGGTVLG